MLGRTNKAYPRVWLRMNVPADPSLIPSLVQATIESKTVIDVSSQPALWGGRLRHCDELLMACGGLDLENASDEKNAADLTQASLIQTLSAIGHESIEFYFLRIRRALEEFQIAGALSALEFAKQEGCVRHVGLHFDGPAIAVLATWQFHDAFEVVLTGPSDLPTVRSLAMERRVGVVVSGHTEDFTALVSVESPADVRNATSRIPAVAL